MPWEPSGRQGTPSRNFWGSREDIRMPWVGRLAGVPWSASITDTSILVLPRNHLRVWASLQNVGSNPVFINFVQDALADWTMRLAPGETVVFDRSMPWPNIVTAVCATGLTSTLLVNDVSQYCDDNGRGEEPGI